ncbi:phosphotriesterase family protein [Herbiconiux liukaitaii]|uniref:phosphotriesterase family protein n=1 Tax=Herbiconiux liukaitaii TaxID=3342799 RepID=UPI0035B76AFE
MTWVGGADRVGQVPRVIRTVLGDVEPGSVGVVDSHDHLFLTTPVLPGEELDDEAAAGAELRAFSAAGGGTLVQWTPRGLGRGLPALRRLSASTGVHVVAATGRHRRVVYSSGAVVPGLSTRELADAFLGDVVERGCGLIKIGIGVDAIAPDEASALHAAALAHHATGVPLAIHLEQGSAFGLVLDALRGLGVSERSIVLGHLGRNPSIDEIVSAAQSGAWLCLDTPSPQQPNGMDRLALILETLVDRGHLPQLLLGADRTAARSRSEPRASGPVALLETVAPRLRDLLGAEAVSRILAANPSRAWSF